jgi:hypothetical protein
MKQISSIFLATLLCGTVCLASNNAWAKGGRGYSTSSGYSDQPVDTTLLSKPDSDRSGGSVDGQPVSEPSLVLSNNLNKSSVTPSFQTGGVPSSPSFPQPTCGDKPTGSDDTWHPVFIDGGNLDNIRSQFCEDAITTVREDTKVKTVQVASFNSRDRALTFAQLVGGEVGKPTYPNNVEQTTNLKEANTSASVVTTPAPASAVTTPTPVLPVTPSPITPSDPPPSTPSSSPSQENTNSGGAALIFLALLLLGIWITARKVLPRNNHSNKLQAEQPDTKKPSTVKETVGQIATLIVIGLMFRGCITGSNKSAISGSSTSACSQAEAKLERARERTSEWSQEHTTLTEDNFDEATSIASYEADAMNERDRACR